MLGQWGVYGNPTGCSPAYFPGAKVASFRDQMSGLQLCGNFLEPHESRGASARLSLPCAKPMYVASPGHYMGEGAMVEADPFCVSPRCRWHLGSITRALSALRLSGSVADLPAHPFLRRRAPPEHDATSAVFCGTHLWPRAPSFAFSLCLCA